MFKSIFSFSPQTTVYFEKHFDDVAFYARRKEWDMTAQTVRITSKPKTNSSSAFNNAPSPACPSQASNTPNTPYMSQNAYVPRPSYNSSATGQTNPAPPFQFIQTAARAKAAYYLPQQQNVCTPPPVVAEETVISSDQPPQQETSDNTTGFLTNTSGSTFHDMSMNNI